MMVQEKPIGVFDSGLGGLTVVHAIQQVLPHESVIYLGDTARVPYGNKSKTIVEEYAMQISRFLVEKGAKLIVVACNTASALALAGLKQQLEIPIIGVITPGVKAGLAATRNNHIGVLGTLATINSTAYETVLKEINPEIKVTSQACPLFVPLVEEGWISGPITEAIVEEYLTPVNQESSDTLILGCTHYPLLKDTIEKKVKAGTILIDSADEVAHTTQTVLMEKRLLNSNDQQGELFCYVTDLPARFEQVAQQFLGDTLTHVRQIHLP